jgi:hypothetical protein
MEGRFLSFHVFNQPADPFVQQRIQHPRDKQSVVLDLPVEFLALVTHRGSANRPVEMARLGLSYRKTGNSLICSFCAAMPSRNTLFSCGGGFVTNKKPPAVAHQRQSFWGRHD